MPFSKKKKILFNLQHNEMLNPEEDEFSDFLNLLEQLNYIIIKTENEDSLDKYLPETDVLVIGNPIDDYFSINERKKIMNFVRYGGGLLLISEYGGDSLQKTNLNDIAKHFGIYFLKNIVKEHNEINENCPSILLVRPSQNHELTAHVREIMIGGTCSMALDKNSKPLFYLNQNTWTEIYDKSSKQWIKEEEGKRQIISAYTEYGRGKVLALGDIDLFTNDPNIGISKLDNRRLMSNIFNWLVSPVKDSDVMIWMLDQFGMVQSEIKETFDKINNIIETLTIMEQRITNLENGAKLNHKDVNMNEISKKNS